MKKKLSILGLLLVLASICLVIWTFSEFSHSGFQDIALVDAQIDSHGWGGYEIRIGPDEAVPVAPRYIDNYNYEFSGESYDAVIRSRIMTEEESLAEGGLYLSYSGCGVELFLDGQLFYSDFQTFLRDANGFLILTEDDFGLVSGPRDITIGLPATIGSSDGHVGKTLTMIVYYPYADTWGVVVPPVLRSVVTTLSAATTHSVVPMLWQVFWGVMMVIMAAGCMISLSSGSFQAKHILLLFVYTVSFFVNAYQSTMGFYSGFYDRINKAASWLPCDLQTLERTALILFGLLLLCLELRESRQDKRKLPAAQTLVFVLIGFWITAMQNSAELENGVWDYLPTLIYNLIMGNWLPMTAMAASIIIYIITLQTIVQFVSQWIDEWRTRSRMKERSRFARENYEMIMQVDEDSRRRKHEMKHHMQTIRSLLSARAVEKAEKYIEKLIQETDQFAETTYSENVVVNSIVGIRLNQAKKEGIAVQSHIHVPVRLEVDDVDLNSLLSNMLENAIEACMRMEDREEAYINLEIRKNQRFLFIECENSVDRGEILEAGQRTVKDHPKEHGFGLRAMSAVAEKYASIIQVEREPGRFTARTNLCLLE